MAPPQHRFSRRFLTMLIFITSIAIVLLSRMEEAPRNETQPPVSTTQQDAPQTQDSLLQQRQ